MATTVNIEAKTDVGVVRDHNEDNFIASQSLLTDTEFSIPNRGQKIKLDKHGAVLVVADGMGGLNAGEVASEVAVDTVKREFLQNATQYSSNPNLAKTFIKETILKAHYAVVSHSQMNPDCAGMGTTLVIAWVIGLDLYVGWVGDSRCYVFNPKNRFFEPFTEDHSFVWQTLVKNGKISPEEARLHPESNIITQSIGDPANAPKPDTLDCPLQDGDRILVCSDGLNSMIPDEDIKEELNKSLSTSITCDSLIAKAKQAGGHDNITVLLLDIVNSVGVRSKTSSKKPTMKLPIWVYATGIGLVIIIAALLVFIKIETQNASTNSDNIVIQDTVRQKTRIVAEISKSEENDNLNQDSNSKNTTSREKNTTTTKVSKQDIDRPSLSIPEVKDDGKRNNSSSQSQILDNILNKEEKENQKNDLTTISKVNKSEIPSNPSINENQLINEIKKIKDKFNNNQELFNDLDKVEEHYSKGRIKDYSNARERLLNLEKAHNFISCLKNEKINANKNDKRKINRLIENLEDLRDKLIDPEENRSNNIFTRFININSKELCIKS